MRRTVGLMVAISVAILSLLAVASIQADAIPAPTAGTYTPITPTRLLDSRSELGLDAGFGRTVNGGQTVGLQVTGRGGVPVGEVGAVALNVTVADPTGPGYVTVYATGRPLPLASNVNYVAGQTVANLVLAPVGVDGKVNLTVSGHGVRLIADVQGYYTSGAPATAGSYGTFAPSRLLDTRRGIGAPIAQVANGQSLSLTVVGRGGVPALDVGAVALNVTATGAAGSGYVTAYASGSALPKTSAINYVAGQTTPALVIAPVGADGKVNLRVSGATVSLVADVQGYFLSGGSTDAGSYNVVTPKRLLDTRIGLGAKKAAVVTGVTASISVTGLAGIPATGVRAVVLTVTETQPTAAGSVTVWAHGTALPLTSNLNFAHGATVPNLVIAPVGADGKVSIRMSGNGTVQLFADVSGYIR